jgi:hypothetical protein
MTFCIDSFNSIILVTLVVYRKSHLYTSISIRKSLISRKCFVVSQFLHTVEGLYLAAVDWSLDAAAY